MSARRDHYKPRIAASTGRRRLNEAVDYLRAAVQGDRLDEVAAEVEAIADREDARK